jgi:AraC-like DNA-binding protein
LENREGESVSAGNGVLVSDYLKLIERYYVQEKSVAFYARKLHVTANYLNIVCRRNLHKTAKKLLQNRILLEAKRRLLINEQSVKEIAYALGFEDPAYFSNVFRLKAGETPAAFRKKL